jgi:hypothetical protein
VPSPLIFGTKIAIVTIAANSIGAAIFAIGEKCRATESISSAE